MIKTSFAVFFILPYVVLIKVASALECSHLVVTGAQYANCDGEYKLVTGKTVSWATERPIYKHLKKDRYIFWNSHGVGWSIGQGAYLETGAYWHNSGSDQSEPWLSKWQEDVVVACAEQTKAQCCDAISATSSGETLRDQPTYLGIYVLTNDQYNTRPVYHKRANKAAGDLYIYYFQSEKPDVGLWVVGPSIGQLTAGIRNKDDSKCVNDLPRRWKFAARSGVWSDSDPSLTVSCYNYPTENKFESRRIRPIKSRNTQSINKNFQTVVDELAESPRSSEEFQEDNLLDVPEKEERRQDCLWSRWGRWSECSRSCGRGIKKRVRRVETRAKGGGKRCRGGNRDTKRCNISECRTTTRSTTTRRTTTTTRRTTTRRTTTTTRRVTTTTRRWTPASRRLTTTTRWTTARSIQRRTTTRDPSIRVNCWQCGSLFSTDAPDCEKFDKTDQSQVKLCDKGSACLYYSYDKSDTEKEVIRECFPTNILLGTLENPVVPADTCSPQQVDSDGVEACICTTNFCSGLDERDRVSSHFSPDRAVEDDQRNSFRTEKNRYKEEEDINRKAEKYREEDRYREKDRYREEDRYREDNRNREEDRYREDNGNREADRYREDDRYRNVEENLTTNQQDRITRRPDRQNTSQNRISSRPVQESRITVRPDRFQQEENQFSQERSRPRNEQERDRFRTDESRVQAESINSRNDRVKCYQCGKLFSRSGNSACLSFDEFNPQHEGYCQQGEVCLWYSWQKSKTNTAEIRECISKSVVLGTIETPLTVRGECTPEDISPNSRSKVIACLCESDLCNLNLPGSRQSSSKLSDFQETNRRQSTRRDPIPFEGEDEKQQSQSRENSRSRDANQRQQKAQRQDSNRQPQISNSDRRKKQKVSQVPRERIDSTPGLQCYSCGSLLDPDKTCDEFSRTNQSQVQTCLTGEVCLFYVWQKSSIETASLRECFPQAVLLGTLANPLKPYPSCQVRDITDDGSGSTKACYCETDFCNDDEGQDEIDDYEYEYKESNLERNDIFDDIIDDKTITTSTRRSSFTNTRRPTFTTTRRPIVTSTRKPPSQPVKQQTTRTEVQGGTCPTDFVSVGSECYFVSKERAGWLQAKKRCEKRKARLVSLDSRDKMSRLLEYVSKENRRRDGSFWLAGNDIFEEGRWEWEAAEVIAEESYTLVASDWGWLDPDTQQTDEENCLSWSVSFGFSLDDQESGWQSSSCCNSLRYICQT